MIPGLDILAGGPEAWASWLAVQLFKFYVWFFGFTATAWMRFSAADFFMGDPTVEGSVVQNGQRTLTYIAYFLVGISFIYSLIRVILEKRGDGIKAIAFMMARVVIAQGAAVSIAFALIKAGDTAGPWIASQISGVGLDKLTSVGDVDTNALAAKMKGTAAVMAFLLMNFTLPWLVLAGIVNFLFVNGSYVIAIIVMIALPSLAATSTSDRGKERFDRAAGWLLAASIYKIAAGVVWGVAIALISLNAFGSDKANNLPGGSGAPIGYVLTGFIAVLMSVFILPVLIRLAVPAMAGVSGLNVGKILGTIAATAGVAAGAIATFGAASAAAGASGASGASGAAGASEASGAGTGTGAASGASSGSQTSGGGIPASGESTNKKTRSTTGSDSQKALDQGGGQGSGNGPSTGSRPDAGALTETGGDSAGGAPQNTAGAGGEQGSSPSNAGGNSGGSSAGSGPRGAGQFGYGAQMIGAHAHQLASESARDLEEALGEGEKI